MIVYEFECICNGQFEAWFESRSDFKGQSGDGLITCPYCGSIDVHKILSPVAVHSSPTHPIQSTPQSHESANPIETVTEFLHTVQDFVEKNFEDVGSKLAEESLKIRYGVKDARNIRGFATSDEEKMLKEEGIELLKIPLVKKPSDQKLN